VDFFQRGCYERCERRSAEVREIAENARISREMMFTAQQTTAVTDEPATAVVWVIGAENFAARRVSEGKLQENSLA
jgi:hypothetical protein